MSEAKRPIVIWYLIGGVVLVCLLVIIAATWWSWPPSNPADGLDSYTDVSRDALLAPHDFFGENLENIVYLDQGWKPRDSMDFYTRTQGSRLLPYSWFLALEQADTDKSFRAPENMSRLRFLNQKPNISNPDGLPVGFVKEPKWSAEDEEHLGLTCAACHTAQINYKRIGLRIDGGPSMGDIETLLLDLTGALKKTLDEPNKFDRFAAKVLKAEHTGQDKMTLRQQLKQVHEHRSAVDTRDRSDHPYGFARLDAFGRILNQVLVTNLGITDANQRRSPNAPVSYPFLWDTPHHDFVQWNAIAPNRTLKSRTLGSLSRNVGEVLVSSVRLRYRCRNQDHLDTTLRCE